MDEQKVTINCDKITMIMSFGNVVLAVEVHLVLLLLIIAFVKYIFFN